MHVLLPAITAALCTLAACKATHEPPLSWPSQLTMAAHGAALEQWMPWPAGGAALTIRLEDRDGLPRTHVNAGDVTLRWIEKDTPQPIALSRTAPSEPGYTLLLLLPATTDAQAQVMARAVAEFVARRPQGEAVALYRWGNAIDQLAGFSRDRADIARVLARMPTRAPGAAVMAPAAALRSAVGEVTRIGNRALHEPRHVVVIGHDVPGALPGSHEQGRAAVVQWVLGGASGKDEAIAALGRGRVVFWDADEELPGALTHAGERLDAFRQAYYRIGVCGVEHGKSVAVETLDQESWLHVRIPPSLPEERDGICDAQAILAGTRAYPDTIELLFDEEEDAAYRDRMARKSREDFWVAIRFGAASKTVKARVHLRGDGTFECERRSYTVKLSDKRPRYLMPGFAADEFYLISMCAEEHYIKAYTAYQLLHRLGLFLPAFRLIEVRVNGESQGVYLVVEKPKEVLASRHSRVRSIIRRRYEPDQTAPELKYAAAGEDAGKSAYYQVLEALAGKSGDGLIGALEEHLDFRGYLGFLAFHSLLQNGDYADEVWMVSTDRLRADGAIGDWFSFMGWDPDDIFDVCHYEGAYAHADRYGLSFCAEAELDDRVLADPAAYARYVERLEQLLAEITDEVFAQAAVATRSALLPYLRRPDVAAIMWGAPADVASVSEAMAAEITAATERLVDAFRRRRQLLVERVASYRSDQSGVLTEERAPAPGSQGP